MFNKVKKRLFPTCLPRHRENYMCSCFHVKYLFKWNRTESPTLTLYNPLWIFELQGVPKDIRAHNSIFHKKFHTLPDSETLWNPTLHKIKLTCPWIPYGQHTCLWRSSHSYWSSLTHLLLSSAPLFTDEIWRSYNCVKPLLVTSFIWNWQPHPSSYKTITSIVI